METTQTPKSLLDGITPGPWSFDGPNLKKEIFCFSFYSGSQVKPKWIFDISFYSDHGTETDLSMARLIVAAPSLAAENEQLKKENDRIKEGRAAEQFDLQRLAIENEELKSSNSLLVEALGDCKYRLEDNSPPEYVIEIINTALNQVSQSLK